LTALAQIFLSYAREDEEKAEKLYQQLSDAGFKSWMDTKDILPGERWELAIQEAIRCSDLFLVCLSKASVKKRGWFQKEIRKARDVSNGMLDSDIYLIPVRLEDCDMPESLRCFQWVNLFEEDGWERLVEAIQAGMDRREEASRPAPSITTPYIVRFSRIRWDETVGALIALSQEEPLVKLIVEHLERVWRHLSEYVCAPGTQFDQSPQWLEGTKALESLATIEPSMPAAQVLLVRTKKVIADGLSRAATGLYAGQHWREACILLEQVLKIEPDHRAAQEEYRRAIKRWQRARSHSRLLS
jgi:hypothetical protein